MNNVSLLVWVGLASFVLGATFAFMLLSSKTASFSVWRKIAGGLAIWVAVGILLLPIMFIPALGFGGLILSVFGLIMAGMSYWKWWVLWLPAP